jgi:phosphatidylglycerol lysyltransferase
MKKRLLHSLGPLVGLLFFALALLVIHNELREYHYHDIADRLLSIPSLHILLAAGLTILSYLIMTGYDIMALQYIKYPLPYRKIALASFIGYAFSNNIGLSMLAGGSVRYRLYSAWGLSAGDITKVVVFCSLTLWMGFLTLGGIIFLLEPMITPEQLHLPFSSVRYLGLIFLLLVGCYLSWGLLRKRPIRIFGWEVDLPSFRIFLIQIAVASLDWILAGSVLYALMPAAAGLSFMKFMGIYLLAQTAGLLSQIPGGLGVFETVIIMLLSRNLPAPALLGSLLVYRMIYYLIPLMIAAAMLGGREILEKKEGVKNAVTIFGRWITVIAPQILSITTFVSGVILIFSGATPTVGSRLLWLKDFLPLPVMEISHFLGSIAGMGLLLLARGIQQRLDAAYVFTVLLLAAGIGVSIFKGFDYEEAIVLSIMLGVLLPCRRYFYRKASIFSQRFTPAWITAISIIFLGSIWVGLFSYKHIEYSQELWWQFAFSGDASRFLRATIGIIAVTLFFAVRILLSPSHRGPMPAGAEELERARLVIINSRKTYSNLALLGDKKILFSESGKSFIMYSIEKRSWVALGDPVGLEEESNELVWRFRELSDRFGGWSVFYEVEKENLHLYLDLGLVIIKIGEEARVFLPSFALEGKQHKEFRHTLNHLEKTGCSFDIIPAGSIPSFMPEFKRISDAWLERKNTKEKGFSLGFFSEAYMKYFPAAVVRKDGKTLAFANIWAGGEKEELSIDLMRYLPDAPQGIMDYLFINMMLWGKQEGYQWFNIGMAPLSGLEDHALAPLWNRVGAFIFRYGEHFYNFQGLRQYKEKFDPEWEPKYIAVPGGLKLPKIFTNVATLISGSLKGVVTK